MARIEKGDLLLFVKGDKGFYSQSSGMQHLVFPNRKTPVNKSGVYRVLEDCFLKEGTNYCFAEVEYAGKIGSKGIRDSYICVVNEEQTINFDKSHQTIFIVDKTEEKVLHSNMIALRRGNRIWDMYNRLIRGDNCHPLTLQNLLEDWEAEFDETSLMLASSAFYINTRESNIKRLVNVENKFVAMQTEYGVKVAAIIGDNVGFFDMHVDNLEGEDISFSDIRKFAEDNMLGSRYCYEVDNTVEVRVLGGTYRFKVFRISDSGFSLTKFNEMQSSLKESREKLTTLCKKVGRNASRKSIDELRKLAPANLLRHNV